MEIKFVDQDVERKVGRITPKQVEKLLEMKPQTEVSKLYSNKFDVVEVGIKDQTVTLKLILKGKPGFRFVTYLRWYVELVQQKWIENPMLNRSGLATLLWNDLKPNNLRRRLEQKLQHGTLTEDEKKMIIKNVEEFTHKVKKSLEI